MISPFEKREVKLYISYAQLDFLIKLIENSVPSSSDEQAILRLYEELNKKLEELKNEP